MVKVWYTNQKNKGISKASICSPFFKLEAKFKCQVKEDNVPGSEHLKICNYLTKKLFLQKDEEIRNCLKHENDFTHTEMLAPYKVASKGLPPI